MGYILAFIVIILAIYLFVVYVLPVIAAAAGIIAGVIAVIAVAVGGFNAIKNYVVAIREEMDFKNWYWPNRDEPAKRSYFFGPGYRQLGETISYAFRLNVRSGRAITNTAMRWRGDPGVWGMCKTIGVTIYQIVAYICIYGIGTVLCAAVALIHGSVTTIFMVIFYIIFSVVWLVDRIYLWRMKIRSDCPNCHSRFLIPHFECPECGSIHKKLVPGPYGVWHHTCLCGNKLPSTFFTGRSELKAICPCCNNPLVASDARPLVFQLVGGTKAGKTVYISAFFHQFLQKLRRSKDLKVTISEEYQAHFDSMEEWYRGGDCPATAQLNSQMYPVLVDGGGVRRQFSIYDIAGEMFDGHTADSQIQQQQFHYCDGLIFIMDPLSGGELRRSRLDETGDISDFSDMAAEDVVTNFVNYLIRTGHAKANARCHIPLSVVIAKCDVPEVKRLLSPAKIRSEFNKCDDPNMTLEGMRDELCRQFLVDIGLSAAVENLEAQFTNVHYFPVSAMGHEADGSRYEPWGVYESIEWMLPLADKEFAEKIVEDSQQMRI